MMIKKFQFLFMSIWFFASVFAQNIPEINLDIYLQNHGFLLSPNHSKTNEGYSSAAQRLAFQEELKNARHIKTVAEIGFNAGHSCETFFESLDNAEVVSFDINVHPYTKIGVEFMQKKYPGRFYFIEGNSNQTVKKYAESTGKKFDLIYIDGNHDFNIALNDIINCQKLAHKNTIVWIDDYAPWGVKKVVDYCVEKGLIKIDKSMSVMDKVGPREWVQVKYNYLSESEKFFSHIYENCLWGKDNEGMPLSGPGSSLEQGKLFIQYLQNFLDSHPIESVVDLGCGDWVLAREINWGKRNYLGIDIVESLVKRNQSKYGSETISFLHLDCGSEPIPKGDLLVCKDVLMHLPNSSVFRILSESKKFKYCIFINDVHPKGTRNVDIPSCGFRFLNLTQPPFNLIPIKSDYYMSGNSMKQILLIKN